MESSSACPIETLNPDSDLRRLVALSVEKRDGSLTEISSGQVFFQAGGNVSFAIDENRDEILINVLDAGGNEDPYYRQKLEALSDLPSDSSVSGPFPEPDARGRSLDVHFGFSVDREHEQCASRSGLRRLLPGRGCL